MSGWLSQTPIIIKNRIIQQESSDEMYNPCHITPEEYFDERVNLESRDIGRPIEQTTKTQKFKAQLWLCEEYPLSLPEQVSNISGIGVCGRGLHI